MPRARAGFVSRNRDSGSSVSKERVISGGLRIGGGGAIISLHFSFTCMRDSTTGRFSRPSFMIEFGKKAYLRMFLFFDI
jgi:hypothetical protein